MLALRTGERALERISAEMLRRVAAGDAGALRAIYDAEAPAMLGVAMRLLRRRALAKEAVHDAFVQVWQRAASFDPARGEAKAWLYAVLRHRALNIRRDEVRTELSDDIETFEVPNGEESAEAMVIRLSETTRCAAASSASSRRVARRSPSSISTASATASSPAASGSRSARRNRGSAAPCSH